jgi:hypothetical protein
MSRICYQLHKVFFEFFSTRYQTLEVFKMSKLGLSTTKSQFLALLKKSPVVFVFGTWYKRRKKN